MEIPLKISTKIYGLIIKHKVSHGHKNLDEAIACMVEMAVGLLDDDVKHTGFFQSALNSYRVGVMLKTEILNDEVEKNSKYVQETILAAVVVVIMVGTGYILGKIT